MQNEDNLLPCLIAALFFYRLKQRLILSCVFRQTDTPELHIHFRIRQRNNDFIIRDGIIGIRNIRYE